MINVNNLEQMLLSEYKKTYFFLGLSMIIYYLLPLFQVPLYVFSFDNLDSTIVWSKILAESGKIFASSDVIVPNIMQGLSRMTYGSEFHGLLWLFYFFDTEIAFRINAILVHVIAYISIWIFLSRYILSKHPLISLLVSIYFATLPFHLGAGLTTSLLPLYVYIFFNIKNGVEKKYEWFLLILIPFFADLVFLYIFVITFTFIWVIYEMFQNKKVYKRLLIALFLVSITFIFVEYRLFYSMLLERTFISHRSEFSIYFNKSFLDSYTLSLQFFLDGWSQHQRSLMMPILLPFIVLSMSILFFKQKLSAVESIVVWGIFSLFYVLNIWTEEFINRYTLPGLFLISILLLWKSKKNKDFLFLLLLQIILSLYYGFCYYDGFSALKDIFPILNVFNISRAAFIQPFIWVVILGLTFKILIKKLKFTIIVLIFIIGYQYLESMDIRNFQNFQKEKMFTFQQYYAPTIFKEILKDINLPIEQFHVISYGLEPAIAEYNGLYTVDGYSTNYPLSYKQKFRTLQEKCLEDMPGNVALFDQWGSKLYLLCAPSEPDTYNFFIDRNITEIALTADISAMCKMNVDYLISANKIREDKDYALSLINHYESKDTLWKIWLYKLKCKL